MCGCDSADAREDREREGRRLHCVAGAGGPDCAGNEGYERCLAGLGKKRVTRAAEKKLR